jgi:hypothetical protein
MQTQHKVELDSRDSKGGQAGAGGYGGPGQAPAVQMIPTGVCWQCAERGILKLW